MNVIEKIRQYILGGDERSRKAKINIFYMMFIKGATILANLLLIPLTLHYVDSATYGIWLTLSSMITWISFFDIGLNHGLKNRLTEAFAHANLELGRTYVSTTYALLSLIFIPLMLILLLAVPHLNWSSILNLPEKQSDGLVISVCIIVVYFCLNFILSTINVVINADQKPADSSLRVLVQQIVTIAMIYILTLTTDGSLVRLCTALCIAPLIVVLLFNFTLFSKRYKEIAPSLKYIDFKKTPDLLKLGVQFFIIQIAGVIQFQMVNFLIIRIYCSKDITAYDIANKYYGIIYMVWGVMITPLWAAVTDALAKNDVEWVLRAEREYLKMSVPFTACAIFMLLISPLVYHIWVGDDINISPMLNLTIMIYNVVLMLGSTFVYILNGAGKLKVQTIVCCISPIVFLTTTYTLISMGVGVYAIIIGSIVANFNGFLVAPIQCHKLLHKKS